MKLADMYSVSHVTVQLAMKILTAEGVLVRRPYHGTVVADLDRSRLVPAGGVHRFALLMQMEGQNLSNFYYKELTAGVTTAAAELGCEISLVGYSNLDSVDFSQSFSGFLMILPTRDEALTIKRRGMPAVLLDICFSRLGLGFVRTDNYSGVSQMMRHLRKLGHRRILYVCFQGPEPEEKLAIAERRSAYRALSKKYGMDWDGDFVWMRDLASRLENRDFTAIFSDSYASTILSLKVLQEKGIRIPEDVSFVSFDDLDNAEHFSKPLTVVKQRLETIGYMGLNLLMDEEALPKARILVKPELIVRQSTRQL